MDEKKKNNNPILYISKEDCCGCCACVSICPKDAISMNVDEEGFEYPKIDMRLCIKCFQCISVCPVKNATCRRLL